MGGRCGLLLLGLDRLGLSAGDVFLASLVGLGLRLGVRYFLLGPVEPTFPTLLHGSHQAATHTDGENRADRREP